MKHYKVTLHNGSYPMVYKCSTIAEAYGCLAELKGLLPGAYINLNAIMEVLVDMKHGKLALPLYSVYPYSIEAKDGEVQA